MRKTTPTVSVPQVIKAAGYEAKVNILFKAYSYRSDAPTYYAGVAQAAKAAAAIFKAAGFTVLRTSSKSYSGGDSIDIVLKSELTDSQKQSNESLRTWPVFVPCSSSEYHKEPREKLAETIEWAFQSGSFDGMTDSYNYATEGRIMVTAPDGQKTELSGKYVFIRFE